MSKHIAFTGHRKMVSSIRATSLVRRLVQFRKDGYEYLHHGDCLGMDAAVHRIAIQAGFCVFIHPPVSEKKRAFCQGGHVLSPFPYLERNHMMVDASDVLLAVPKTYVEVLRSGTWSTIRYARRRKVEVIII